MLKGLFWDFLGKIFSQGFAFIASIFLARLLLPEDFGLVAIAIVFINISQVFIDAGFGAALIQKKEVSDDLYSSVFWLNITSGAILSLIFIIISGWIAEFYETPELKQILQYFSLAFLINSFGVVQRTQLIKKMDFRKLSLIAATSTFLSGSIAIYIAFETKSYWALVVQQLSMFGFSTILLWIINSWKPKFHFSLTDLKSVWGFSSMMFTDSILTNIIDSTDTMLIGKIFPTHSLGLYSRAKNLSEMVRSYSSSGVASIVFPAISKIQNQKKEVEQLFLRMIASISVFSVLLALILFKFAEPLILVLYTSKWAGSIFFFQVFIISSFLYPLNAVSTSTLTGLGHIKIAFNYGLIKKALRLLSFGIALSLGIEAFAYAISVSVFLVFAINAHAIKRKLDIKIIEIFAPLLLNLGIAASVFAASLGFEYFFPDPNYLNYAIEFMLIVSLYILLQYTLNYRIFNYWTTRFKEKFSKKSKSEEE